MGPVKDLLISPQCSNTAEGDADPPAADARPLLKGCERRFRPVAARQRYCSPQCRQAARQWSRWKAQQSYRATAAAKEKRQEQSRRYRERVKERKQARSQKPFRKPRGSSLKFFSSAVATGLAARGIRPQTRSPLRRFCSRACRRAVERVWQRERRWRQAPRPHGKREPNRAADNPDILIQPSG